MDNFKGINFTLTLPNLATHKIGTRTLTSFITGVISFVLECSVRLELFFEARGKIY